MNAKHSSGSSRWMTPPEYIEAARKTLGEIDLDPASCEVANRVVRAKQFYGPGKGSSGANGFMQRWHGRVFLNPPGGRCDVHGYSVERSANPGEKGYFYDDGDLCELKTFSAAKLWWAKLVDEVAKGNCTGAVFVGFSIEILQTAQVDAQSMVPTDFPLCIPARRIAFVDETTGHPVKGMTHASVIVCVLPLLGDEWRGEMAARFARAFAPFGAVVGGVR